MAFFRSRFKLWLLCQPEDKIFENTNDWNNPIAMWVKSQFSKSSVKANRWGIKVNGIDFKCAWAKQLFDGFKENEASGLLTAKRCIEVLEHIKLNRDNLREQQYHEQSL